jgi:hypothetical protein
MAGFVHQVVIRPLTHGHDAVICPVFSPQYVTFGRYNPYCVAVTVKLWSRRFWGHTAFDAC